MLSLFGAGFIGGRFNELYKNEVFIEPRNSINPVNDKVLYFRGTTTNYSVFGDNPAIDFETNLVLFINTLKNLKSNSEVNLISSWFAFHPKGLYSISKLAQEQVLESYCKTFNYKYRIIRLSNVIGGDKGKSKQKNALEFIIDKLKNNEQIDIYSGDNYRNYLHVSDVCKGIKIILDGGEINTSYNIGDNQSYRLVDLIEYCKSKINSKSELKVIETPHFHSVVQVKDYFMNTEKIRELGFVPDYNIWQTLDELCK